MANKHIYAKSASGISDFVYVDLLPEVKRSRQFNMNVIGALFLGVFLSYVLIYMPFRAATEQYETLNALNNDLQHELILTNEEYVSGRAAWVIETIWLKYPEMIDLYINKIIDFLSLQTLVLLIKLTFIHAGEILERFPDLPRKQ